MADDASSSQNNLAPLVSDSYAYVLAELQASIQSMAWVHIPV
jgi:hypothetical protein